MRKILSILLLMFMILMAGCQNDDNKIKSLDDLKHARIGCWATSASEMYAREKFPEAQYMYINFISDMVQSLKQNKIDAFLIDNVYADNLKSEGIDIDYIKEPIGEVKIAYILSKNEEGQKLCHQINEFIKKINENGEIDKLKQKWLKGNESTRTFAKSKLTGKNGKLKIATEAVTIPYIYIKDKNVTGYEVGVIDKFCVEYDYDYEIIVEDFSAMLADVSLNKVNIGMSAIQITEEKAKQVLFSEPTNVDNIVAIINPTSKAATSTKTLDDFKNAKIGCWPECGYEFAARKHFPDAQYVYLYFLSDLVQNLKQNKIDAFVLGKVYADNLIREGVDITYFDNNLGDVPVSFLFTKSEKGQKFRDQMNEFITKLEQSGEIEKLKNKWFTGTEEQRTFTKSQLTGENGTLSVATDAIEPPFVYLKNNEVIGYEVEIFDKFCAAYGYKYEIKNESFETMLADVNLGKIDVGINAIECFPEREKNMLFSKPTHINECVLIINSDSAEGESFIDSIKDRVTATLITENRWQMIVEGIKVTILITILASIFGTLLGFIIYMVYRENNKIINKIIEKFIRIMQGLPLMVLLMFFYYVVFGNVDIDGTVVAIIVFAIWVSVSIFIMLKSGSESIPKGQMEAALALGFSERRAYLKFILPQVITVFFPTYQKALIELLLSTAIVGYIAVQDLTKMGDLIRARTFDAFMPLIVVSVIYFLLSWLLMIFMEKFLTSINPKNRKAEKILKGVNYERKFDKN